MLFSTEGLIECNTFHFCHRLEKNLKFVQLIYSNLTLIFYETVSKQCLNNIKKTKSKEVIIISNSLNNRDRKRARPRDQR